MFLFDLQLGAILPLLKYQVKLVIRVPGQTILQTNPIGVDRPDASLQKIRQALRVRIELQLTALSAVKLEAQSKCAISTVLTG